MEPEIVAPRSQEPQGFKVTQMSGKSKTIKKEERTKYKYFCTFKLNVKGDKKEIGYIIEAENIDKVNELALLRAKKEFTGIRSFTNRKVRTLEDTDKEFIIDSVEDVKSNSKTLSTDTNKIIQQQLEKDSNLVNLEEFERFLNRIREEGDTQIWKVVYTPGRKPRKRDQDSHYFIVVAKTLSEAKEEAKKIITDAGAPYKDKWANYSLVDANDILSSSLYKQYEKQRQNKDVSEAVHKIETIENIQDKLKSMRNSYHEQLQLFVKMSGLNVSYDDNTGYMTYIKPIGVNIMTLGTFKEFIVIPKITKVIKNLPPTKVLAPDRGNAVFFLYIAIRNYDVPRMYYDIDECTIIDPATGQSTTTDYTYMKEGLDKILEKEDD